MATRTGACLCGAVRFEAAPPFSAIYTCHCSMCRRQTSEVFSVTMVAAAGLHLREDRGLRWYRSSATCRRGFCGECGSLLFFEGDVEGQVSVSAGAFDAPLGLARGAHIFVADKGDWYDVPDDAPHHQADTPARTD